MARLWQCGFELQSTTADVEATSFDAGCTIDTTLVRSGSASLKSKVTGVAAISKCTYQFASTEGFANILTRVYINITTLPAAICTIMMLTDSAANTAARVRLATDGTLELWDTNVKIGNSSSPLRNGNWYMVELQSLPVSGATNDTVTARLDGSIFASINTAVGLNLGHSFFRWGIISSTTAEINFDDIALNDDTGSSQNSWPGSGKIIHLKPNVAGDANGFTVQVGGTAGSANNFSRVSETTPDDATSYNGAALLNAEDLFQCTKASIGAFRNINVVAVGVRMADLVAGDAATGVKLELEKVSGGTKTQSANLIPNSTTFLTNAAAAPRNYPIVAYSNPDGGEWTQGFLDSLQIGYINDTVGVQTIAISTVWASIDYEPALFGTTTSTSSTSSTSSSISTTSSSTSSTSTSVSTTSVSTSSTSSSTSTSSTSSSISSTSSSTSSTSLSSTSSSTSTSSTSSSISSTSQSSTSQSSTSQSSSISSTSTSFSSTSSSQSSTSRSTSSTSFSSTSSSSSTSSTTIPPPFIDHSFADRLTLPTNSADLINPFTTAQYSDVGADDGDYFIEYGSEYMIRNYQRKNSNNTDNPQFAWRGRSTVSTLVSPILIQIYNVNSATWETLAVANKIPADTDFSVTVTRTSNVSNYYDSNNYVTFRSYQLVF